MATLIIDTWNSHVSLPTTPTIMPDGCRDLIFKQVKGESPYWFISPLYDAPQTIEMAAQCSMSGFRLQPGTVIDEANLLNSLAPNPDDVSAVIERLERFTSRSHQTVEILDCLTQNDISVQMAANQLGVNIRSLQRHIIKATERTPTYWVRLARVRRAARAMTIESSLLTIAYQCGFSDQSHMTREFQHWFGHTPNAVRAQPALLETLASQGYG